MSVAVCDGSGEQENGKRSCKSERDNERGYKGKVQKRMMVVIQNERVFICWCTSGLEEWFRRRRRVGERARVGA